MTFDLADQLEKLPPNVKKKLLGSKVSSVEAKATPKEKKRPRKTGGTPKTTEVSFLKLDDGRIAEQIYNPQSETPHQFVTLSDSGFEYFPEIAQGNKVYMPAGKELVEKGVVLLPSEPMNYHTDSILSKEIQDFIHRHLDVPLFYEKVSGLYVKYSWIHDQFEVTSYLRARGDYGCGKSRLLQTIGSIAYKPMFCGGSTTSSPIFRLIEMFKGTLVLDEADFKNSDLHMDIIKILNQGYMKGGYVLRTERGSQNWTTKAYEVYGCKVIATREKYTDQALESRMLTVVMEGSKRTDIPLIVGDEFWAKALEIRNKLLFWRFKKYGKFQLNPNHRIAGIENRLNQIIMPILSITEDQVLIKDIQESIKDYQKEMIQDRGLDIEATILEAILKFKKDKDHERTFKKIVDAANELLGCSENDKNKLTSRRVGKKIRDSLKLKTERGMNGFYVIWDDEAIKELMQKYGLNEDAGGSGEIADYEDSMVKNPELGFP